MVGASRRRFVDVAHAAARRAGAARYLERLPDAAVAADRYRDQVPLPLAQRPVGDVVAVEAVPRVSQLVADDVADLGGVAAAAARGEEAQHGARGEGVAGR